MSSITNNVVNTVTLTDEKSYSATFIFSGKETALHGVHTALLTILAGAAVEQEFNRSDIFSCKYNDVFTGNVTIGIRGDRIIISDGHNEFDISCYEAQTYILEPFGLFMPDFVPMINEHLFGCEGITCWMIEELGGYYSGQDSDLWILTSQGMLIATEELHREDTSTYLSPVAVFDLNHIWTEEEVKNNEQIKAIIDASY